jgi:hypothetical protein
MRMNTMPENQLLFKAVLSLSGALSIGAFGVITGLVWGAALGVSLPVAALVVGIAAAVWGAIAFQLTPTGGVIMENKATVNYAVIALHGWLAAIVCIAGLVVWAIGLLVG